MNESQLFEDLKKADARVVAAETDRVAKQEAYERARDERENARNAYEQVLQAIKDFASN